MHRMTGRLAVVVGVIALVVVTLLGPNAQAGWYTANSYYNFWCADATQQRYMFTILPYANESFRSAYRVLGNKGWQQKIRVYFYTENSGTVGYFEPTVPNVVNLNLKFFQTYTSKQMAATLAHETSHLLFSNYTYVSKWWKKSSTMYYVAYTLTESLARFTGDQAFAYGNKYTAAEIKTNLLYNSNWAMVYGGRTTMYVLSWANLGWIYSNASTLNTTNPYLVQQAMWQFQATGYFLNYGFTDRCCAFLTSTLAALRSYGNTTGQYLQSSDPTYQLAYFEKSFGLGYGKYANCTFGLGYYWDRTYLYGDFFYKWYIAL